MLTRSGLQEGEGTVRIAEINGGFVLEGYRGIEVTEQQLGRIPGSFVTRAALTSVDSPPPKGRRMSSGFAHCHPVREKATEPGRRRPTPCCSGVVPPSR